MWMQLIDSQLVEDGTIRTFTYEVAFSWPTIHFSIQKDIRPVEKELFSIFRQCFTKQRYVCHGSRTHELQEEDTAYDIKWKDELCEG